MATVSKITTAKSAPAIVPTPKEEGGNAPKGAKVWHKVLGKLIDDVVTSVDSAENASAKLAVAMYEAIKSSDMSPVEVATWMKSKDSKKSAETLTDWTALFSGKYRAAVDEIKAINEDKSLTEENRKARLMQANRQTKAARNAVTRAVLAGYWLYKIGPESVVVRSNGALRVSHKKEELDGAFAMNNVIKRCKDAGYYVAKVSRAARPAGNTGAGAPPADAGKSLDTSVDYIITMANGKKATDFAGASKDKLQSLLVTLLGTFASPDGATLDTESIVDMYKAAGKGA
jgi:hypothetical protein